VVEKICSQLCSLGLSLDTELIVAEKDAGEDKEKLNLFHIIEKYRKSLQHSTIKHYKKVD